MSSLASMLDLIVKSAIFALAVNELRGMVLAVPVLYGMWQAGGTIMALWLGFCSLGGIALSVVVPVFAARRLGLLKRRQPAAAQ